MLDSKRHINKKSKGQALLPLLILIIIILSLGAAAIELAIGNIVINRYFQEEIIGFYTTEAALENGLLRLLRNPAYSGEDLQINETSCTIDVSGSAPTIVAAECVDNRRLRKIQAEVSFVAGEMEVGKVIETE